MGWMGQKPYCEHSSLTIGPQKNQDEGPLCPALNRISLTGNSVSDTCLSLAKVCRPSQWPRLFRPDPAAKWFMGKVANKMVLI